MNGSLVRPFSNKAKVRCFGYSQRLTKALVDFGIEESFSHAGQRFKEHYGFEMPTSAIRNLCLEHGELVAQISEVETALPEEDGESVVVVETDGTMVPIVEIGTSPNGDQRKNRTVGWNEYKLSLAYSLGQVDPYFEGTFKGPNEAGKAILDCSIHAGATQSTHIHGVGDGAKWIVNQLDQQFGSQVTYLIDFFHLSEYLADAAPSCLGETKTWLEIQQKKLKTGQLDDVLATLETFSEKAEVPDNEAPVRKCIKYILNRRGQFDYKGAIDKGYPIGSGKIESGHRYVVQKRLKLAGAWWKKENAEKMLSLRICRQNAKWDSYWAQKQAS